MKYKKEPISKWVLYSPFLLLAFLVLLVLVVSLFYNDYEFTRNTLFITDEMERLTNLGMPQEIVNDSFERQTQHILYNTQQRIFYAISMVILIIVLSAMFIYAIFRKIIRKMVTFQRELYEEKEKLQKVSDELQYANEQLTYQLHVDSLTQLQNRLALEGVLARMREPKLILLDIDSFKAINEYYGTGIGDYILQDVASLLRGFGQEHHLSIFRTGADEFALVEDSSLDIERYEHLAVELVEIFKGRKVEITHTKESIEINIAIGFSLESDEVFEKASMALAEAKKREIDYLCYFKKIEHTMQYAEQLRWSQCIKNALVANAIIPYYQPIFNRQGEIVKYECLVRLMNEEEAIPPGLFLSTAKKVKRYADIEKILIEKSFKEIIGTSHVISLNLLARDMSDSNVSNYVVEKLKEYGIAKQVVFEILEDESIESLERVEIFIDRVKRMGCKIAIDDFGTGYSNFSYLLKLKPDYIKIDGSLIKALDKDPKSVAIVSAIITFAQKLGILTIAEYVHNENVHALCLELGIDEFQGFYLGEPSMKLKKME